MAKKQQQEVWNCLSVRQPWAWAIVVGAKDVENRGRRSHYTGRLYIHASLTENAHHVEDATDRVARHLGISTDEALARYQRQLKRGRGAIIGSVEMFGCVDSCDSEWFEEGYYGYLFRDARQFTRPIPAKGSPAIPFKFKRQ